MPRSDNGRDLKVPLNAFLWASFLGLKLLTAVLTSENFGTNSEVILGRSIAGIFKGFLDGRLVETFQVLLKSREPKVLQFI